MKKVIVTGGAGFIGSHLAEELVRQGYHVVILDDLSTGKVENIEGLLSREDVEFVKDSVTNLPLLCRLFREVDYAFHLAAISSVPRSIEDPIACHDVNMSGTLKVLLAAKENSVRKVIFASSSAVYGETHTLVQREDMTPNPLSPYAVTKLAGEYYCQVFHQVYGLPTVCLRYFNVYGPRQNSNSQYAAVIPAFIERVTNANPPVIFGDGEQTRDFIFVKDAVEAGILVAENNACGILNIAFGETVTINELAKLVIRISGRNMEVIRQEARPGEIRHSLADISKARTFGFEPKYTLEEGLKGTIAWMRQ